MYTAVPSVLSHQDGALRPGAVRPVCSRSHRLPVSHWVSTAFPSAYGYSDQARASVAIAGGHVRPFCCHARDAHQNVGAELRVPRRWPVVIWRVPRDLRAQNQGPAALQQCEGKQQLVSLDTSLRALGAIAS